MDARELDSDGRTEDCVLALPAMQTTVKRARVAVVVMLLAAGCAAASSEAPDGGGGASGHDASASDGGGPSVADADCPSLAVGLTAVTPTVLLLLDQSGSMADPFGGGGMSRYEAMTYALTDPTVGVVSRLADRVVFGASLYTSHDGSAGGVCPILRSVMPAPDATASIRQLLLTNGPDGDTPTGEAISGAAAILKAIGTDPDSESPLIIVLATDGEPDTCAIPNPQTGQPEATAAVQSAFAAGVRLFILAVGDEVGVPHQQAMANAGAGLPPDGSGGNAPLYQAADPAELVARFDEIVNGVRTCLFNLDGAVDPALADTGTVTLDGVTLTQDGPDGWRFVDEDTIELLGAACDTVLGDPSVVLLAEFSCGVVVE